MANTFNQAQIPPVPFMFRPVLDTYKKVSGPCETSGEFMRTQLQEQRYAVQLWTLAGGGGANATVAAGTERRSFAEGIGDAGTNLGWGTPALTQAQTNLYPNGSLNNAKEGAFVARSLGFSIMRPFVYNATTGERQYSPVIDAYAPRVARALLESIEWSMLQRDNNVSLNIGLGQLWPGAQQIKECNFPTMNEPNGANIMLPFRRDYVFIDDNQGSQNFLVGVNSRLLTFVTDPADPIPANYALPIMTSVYGDVMSVAEACATVTGNSSVVAEVDKLLARGFTPAQAYEMITGKR